MLIEARDKGALGVLRPSDKGQPSDSAQITLCRSSIRLLMRPKRLFFSLPK